MHTNVSLTSHLFYRCVTCCQHVTCKVSSSHMYLTLQSMSANCKALCPNALWRVRRTFMELSCMYSTTPWESTCGSHDEECTYSGSMNPVHIQCLIRPDEKVLPLSRHRSSNTPNKHFKYSGSMLIDHGLVASHGAPAGKFGDVLSFYMKRITVFAGLFCFCKVPKHEFGHDTDRHGRYRYKHTKNSTSPQPEPNGRRPGPGFGPKSGHQTNLNLILLARAILGNWDFPLKWLFQSGRWPCQK